MENLVFVFVSNVTLRSWFEEEAYLWDKFIYNPLRIREEPETQQLRQTRKPCTQQEKLKQHFQVLGLYLSVFNVYSEGDPEIKEN